MKAQLRTSLSLLLTSCMLISTGCGRKTSEEIARDFEAAKIESQVKSEDRTTNEDSGNEVTLDYSIDIPKVHKTLKVNAAVNVGDMSTYGVYKSENFEKNDKYIEELAKRIFDGGNFETLLPPGAASKEKCREYSDRVMSDIKTASNETGNTITDYERYYYNGMSFLLHAYGVRDDKENGELTEPEEGKYYYVVSGDDNSSFEKSCILIGDIDGEKWVLMDEYSEENNAYFVGGPISLIPYSYAGVSIFASYELDEDEKQLANAAIPVADSFMNKLSITGFAPEYINKVKLDSDFTEKGQVGYYVNYTPVLDGKNHAFMNNGISNIKDTKCYTSQKNVRICVNNDRVVYAEILNDTPAGERIEGKNKFLDFSEVDEIFRDNFIKYYPKDFITSNIMISDVELSYITVKDTGNTTKIVPAWIYYKSSGAMNELRMAVMAITAIDGEIIIFDGYGIGQG